VRIAGKLVSGDHYGIRHKPTELDLRSWLEKSLRSLSTKSETAGAIRYALSLWRALTRYVDDGPLEIDNSAAERTLRAVALGCKNYLFCGSNSRSELADCHVKLALGKDSVARSTMVGEFPPVYSRLKAVACSSELPSGMTAFWKGSLRWLSLKKLHLTLQYFWPKLAWDEESSN
jgi:hypothetical protein